MDVHTLLERLGGQDAWVRRAWALALVAVSVVSLMAIKKVVARRLARFAAKTVSRVDDVLAEMVARTSLLFPLAISIFVVVAVVPLAPQLERMARGLAFVLCLLQTGVWVSQTSLEQLRAIPGMLSDIIRKQERARFDRAHFAEYGDFALMFEVVYYVLDADYSPLAAGVNVETLIPMVTALSTALRSSAHHPRAER